MIRFNFIAIILFLLFFPINTKPVYSGGGVGIGATEFTQMLNNMELVALLAKETEGVAINNSQLMTQIEQLQAQFRAYQNMVQNTNNFKETHWGDVSTSLLELQGVMSAAGALSADGKVLDNTLNSRFMNDPLYRKSGLSTEQYAARYDAWTARSNASLNATLSGSRLTVDDLNTQAALIERIQKQGKTVNGQVEAIQVGNELLSSMAEQILSLRAITAAQNEQTAIWQARYFAQQDAEEAGRRETIEEAAEIINNAPPHRELIGSFTRDIK